MNVPECEHLMFFFVIYESKLNIYWVLYRLIKQAEYLTLTII